MRSHGGLSFQLFNGKDLAGWEGDSTLWSAKTARACSWGTRRDQVNNFLRPTEGDLRRLHPQSSQCGSQRLGQQAAFQFRSVRSAGQRCRATRPTSAPATGQPLRRVEDGTSARHGRASALENLHKGDWNHTSSMHGATKKGKFFFFNLSLTGVESVQV